MAYRWILDDLVAAYLRRRLIDGFRVVADVLPTTFRCLTDDLPTGSHQDRDQGANSAEGIRGSCQRHGKSASGWRGEPRENKRIANYDRG